MKIRKPVTNASTIQARFIGDRLASILIICSLLLVLISTLFPFNFSVITGFSIQTVISRFDHPSNLKDLLSNVLLFLPFGFGLACLAQTRLSRAVGLTVTLAASLSLSLTAEVLQVFLPSRSPTLADILTNTIGGVLGFLCFQFWQRSVLRQSSEAGETRKQCLSLKFLTASFIGYVALAFLVTIALQNGASLSNWDLKFPLLLGNELTGERPWQGHIADVLIADKALSNSEVAQLFSAEKRSIAVNLIADYRLSDGDFRDQTGYLPSLSWQGVPLAAPDKMGVALTSSQWLATSTSAAFLTERIRETSQFSLSTTVATASPTQTGPARIVSLSSDPFQRNFTLGQAGNQLVFRLRTPLTGENGTNPELTIPNVFTDTNFHHLIVTYNGSALQVYVDQPQHSSRLNLSPDVTLFRYLLPFGSWDVHPQPFGIDVYRVLYYGIIFIPLGVLLALITSIVSGGLMFYVVLICQGILLPCLIVEGILANGRTMQFGNLLLSMMMITGTLLMTKLWFSAWLPTRKVHQL